MMNLKYALLTGSVPEIHPPRCFRLLASDERQRALLASCFFPESRLLTGPVSPRHSTGMPTIDFASLTLQDALDLAILIEEEAKERYE